MIKKGGILITYLFIVTLFSSCELIGDIFEFGIWVGVIIVVAIVALLIWIISKFRR